MLLLFLSLLARGAIPDALRDTAGELLAHLSLLFVPAGVGVMVHFPRLAAEWLPIVAGAGRQHGDHHRRYARSSCAR